jgi:ribosomal protein L37E
MSVKYCKSCGAKNSYVGLEPKFCSSCGAPLNQSLKKVSRGSIANSNISESLVNNDDTTNIDFVPHIGRLQYDIEVSNKKTFTFEEIAGRPLNESKSTEEER